MRGENKNPIRSHFEVMKRLARYLYKSDSDRGLFKLAVRLRPRRRTSATVEAILIVNKLAWTRLLLPCGPAVVLDRSDAGRGGPQFPVMAR